MKLPIFAGVAFVVGIAGGTGVGVMRAPKPAPVAAHSDSTQAGAPAAHGAHAETAHDAVAAAAAGQTPAPVAHDSSSTDAAAHAEAHAHTTADPHGPARTAAAIPPALHVASSQALAMRAPEDFRQVARILTTMKPTDAAKIMAFLGDDLVEGIVRAVGPRQAAVLLVQIPPQRAAALSKRLIQSPTVEAK